MFSWWNSGKPKKHNNYYNIQSNPNSSNTDGSFTMANSISFFSPLRNSSDCSRKQIFREIFVFRHEIVCCVYSLESPRRGDATEYTKHTIIVKSVDRKYFPKLSPFASWPGAMIYPQWLEQPISRTNFLSPKDVRDIEVRLYNGHTNKEELQLKNHPGQSGGKLL